MRVEREHRLRILGATIGIQVELTVVLVERAEQHLLEAIRRTHGVSTT